MDCISIPRELLPRLTDLSGSKLNLYLLIWDHQQRGVEATRRTLRKATGYSQITIIPGTDTLAKLGLITKHLSEREDGCCLPSTFTLNSACPLAYRGALAIDVVISSQLGDQK